MGMTLVGGDRQIATLNSDGGITLWPEYTVSDAAQALYEMFQYFTYWTEPGKTAVVIRLGTLEPQYMNGYTPTAEATEFWLEVAQCFRSGGQIPTNDL